MAFAFARSFFCAAASNSSASPIARHSLRAGRERGLAPMNVANVQVTTCVSPHDGHMTSIGRRLVDRSIGFPQRRQVIDMGEVGDVGTGPSAGGGGGTALPANSPNPPPSRPK